MKNARIIISSILLVVSSGVYAGMMVMDPADYTFENALREFPRYFNGVPNQIKHAIFDYAKRLSPDDPRFMLRRYYDNKAYSRKFRWQAIGKHFGYKVKGMGNYLMFFGFTSKNGQLAGKRREVPLWAYKSAAKEGDIEYRDKLLRKMTGEYKIYLMPKSIQARTEIILKLHDALSQDKKLRKLLYAFKVLYQANPEDIMGNVIPAIVIYPAGGKKRAQKALKKIYELFKDISATDKKLPYVVYVNDLIAVSQGDMLEKFKESNHKFFEPSRVYFDSMITGEKQDYCLAHPKTGAPLLCDTPAYVPQCRMGECKPVRKYCAGALHASLLRLKNMMRFPIVAEQVQDIINALKTHTYNLKTVQMIADMFELLVNRESQKIKFYETGEVRHMVQRISNMIKSEQERLTAA